VVEGVREWVGGWVGSVLGPVTARSEQRERASEEVEGVREWEGGRCSWPCDSRQRAA
jgi:hypothetical protein